MPDRSAETYRIRLNSNASGVLQIPAVLLVHPSSGSVRLVAVNGSFMVLPGTITVGNTVAQKFHALASEWLRDTGIVSNPVEIFMHPAHVKLLGMGPEILPLVLKEVEKMSGHWFMILDAISPENPVTPEDETSPERTARAWIEWGKERGLLR